MMAAPFLHKSLTCLFSKHSSFVGKSHVTFLFLYSTDSGKQLLNSLTVSEFLIRNHHFSAEAASRLGTALTRLKNLENADSVLSFLKESGFSNAQLEQTIKSWPNVLSANLEGIIKPKIRIFQDFGFNDAEIADIVSRHPLALNYSVNKIVSSLSVLKGLLGSKEEAAKFFGTTGMFLSNLENTLVPNVEFLESCGVPLQRITYFIRRDTRLFTHKPENMRKFVKKIDHMGLDRSSGMFVHALRVVSRMTNETWELKLKTLRELGLTEDDILRMFRNSPTVFAVSEKKMKQVTEVLLETGKYEMSCIINTPTVFHCSIEKRYRPRLQVLRILEKKKLISKWPSLGTLHTMTDARFFEKFVAPYSDKVAKVWSAVGPKGR